jgi:hypothetical protein
MSNKEVEEAVANAHVQFYEVLRKLYNSINNAGHEERRSSDIDYIREQMQKIAELYKDYLP